MTRLFYVAFFILCQFLRTTGEAQDSLLAEMTRQIKTNKYTDINSVIIAKGTDLQYEQYFNGFGRDSLHDTRSSFKSITSLLVGIAIDKGLIHDVDEKVYSFFPEYKDSLHLDARKKNLTIKNVLQMESGFDCDEWNGEKDCESEMIKTKDWVRFSLSLDMKNTPGTVWAYTSCNPVIMGDIIRQVSGMSLMDFAAKYLFAPMGIERYQWTIDPSGHAMTAGSFYMRPLDMIKIGEMVKDKGLWRGKRIVSEKWLAESTRTTIQIPDFSYVKFSRNESAVAQPTYYGYYWYSEVVQTPQFQETVLFASGNGGQYIMIIAKADVVVVFTQGNYNSWKAKRAFDILIKYILPVYERGKG